MTDDERMRILQLIRRLEQCAHNTPVVVQIGSHRFDIDDAFMDASEGEFVLTISTEAAPGSPLRATSD